MDPKKNLNPETKYNCFTRTVLYTVQYSSYISTSSTTSTLRLPLYILSVVDAYQKAYGTGKRVMVMVMMVLQGTYVL